MQMSEQLQVIQHITNFNDYLLCTSTTPCVVKFTADWCGPCRRMAPTFEQTAIQNRDKVLFIEIDIDKADEITNHENVASIPLLLFYSNGVKNTDLTIKGLNILGFQQNFKTFVETMEPTSLSVNDTEEEAVDSSVNNTEDPVDSSIKLEESGDVIIEKTLSEDDVINE